MGFHGSSISANRRMSENSLDYSNGEGKLNISFHSLTIVTWGEQSVHTPGARKATRSSDLPGF